MSTSDCIDCGIETVPEEYYMVHNQVWAAAFGVTPDSRPRDVPGYVKRSPRLTDRLARV